MPPGASNCRVSVTWNDANIQYPAMLDPTWGTANSMAVPRTWFGTAVLTKHVPQYAVAFGGTDSSGAPSTVTEFYDPDTDTWSMGPSMNAARSQPSAVSFNLTGAADGDEVFVSGGLH